MNRDVLLFWYGRSIEFWLLSKAAMHHFNLWQSYQHLHTLAFEMMIKLLIILFDKSIDPNLINTMNTRRIFPEKHDLIRLVRRWNGLNVSPVIRQGTTNAMFLKQGDDIVLSDESWKSFQLTNDPYYSGRYAEGGFRYNKFTIEALDFIYFELRTLAKKELNIEEDSFDEAKDGNLGREHNSDWVKRFALKSNFGVSPDLRIID
jgi:hypothetical protein